MFKTGFFDFSMKYRYSAVDTAEKPLPVTDDRNSSLPNPRTLLIEVMIFVFAHEPSTIIVCAISILPRFSFFSPAPATGRSDPTKLFPMYTASQPVRDHQCAISGRPRVLNHYCNGYCYYTRQGRGADVV